MKNIIAILSLVFPLALYSQADNPDQCNLVDTAKIGKLDIGIYITSIRNIDLEQGLFYADLWMYINVPNPYPDSLRDTHKGCIEEFAHRIVENLEWPEAIDANNGGQPQYRLYSLDNYREDTLWISQKCSAPFKSNWNLANYPFDRQKLSLDLESNETRDQVQFQIMEVKIDTNRMNGYEFNIASNSVNQRKYHTSFGDPNNRSDLSEFDYIQISINMIRGNSWTTFFKLYTGLLISFLISLSVFHIKPTNIDARFGLCVGGMFSAIGSKYIIDNIIPSNYQNTLFDYIHNITFVYIFLITAISILSLKWYEGADLKKKLASKSIDRFSFWLCLTSYGIIIMLNVIFTSDGSSEYSAEIQTFIYFLIGLFSLIIFIVDYLKLKQKTKSHKDTSDE